MAICPHLPDNDDVIIGDCTPFSRREHFPPAIAGVALAISLEEYVAELNRAGVGVRNHIGNWILETPFHKSINEINHCGVRWSDFDANVKCIS